MGVCECVCVYVYHKAIRQQTAHIRKAQLAKHGRAYTLFFKFFILQAPRHPAAQEPATAPVVAPVAAAAAAAAAVRAQPSRRQRSPRQQTPPPSTRATTWTSRPSACGVTVPMRRGVAQQQQQRPAATGTGWSPSRETSGQGPQSGRRGSAMRFDVDEQHKIYIYIYVFCCQEDKVINRGNMRIFLKIQNADAHDGKKTKGEDGDRKDRDDARHRDSKNDSRGVLDARVHTHFY